MTNIGKTVSFNPDTFKIANKQEVNKQQKAEVQNPPEKEYMKDFEQYADKLINMPKSDREWSLSRFSDKISKEPIDKIDLYIDALTDKISELENDKSNVSEKKFEAIHDIYSLIRHVQIDMLRENEINDIKINKSGSAEANINLMN